MHRCILCYFFFIFFVLMSSQITYFMCKSDKTPRNTVHTQLLSEFSSAAPPVFLYFILFFCPYYIVLLEQGQIWSPDGKEHKISLNHLSLPFHCAASLKLRNSDYCCCSLVANVSTCFRYDKSWFNSYDDCQLTPPIPQLITCLFTEKKKRIKKEAINLCLHWLPVAVSFDVTGRWKTRKFKPVPVQHRSWFLYHRKKYTDFFSFFRYSSLDDR